MAILITTIKLPKTEPDTAGPKHLNRTIARVAPVPLFNARSQIL